MPLIDTIMTTKRADYSIEEGATIVSQLKKLAVENPDKAAYIFVDKDLNRTILSRQDVWDKSRRFAAVLHRLGIVKGDVVCNTLTNSPQRLISSFGAILAGAVSMHGQLFLAHGEDIIKSWEDTRCKAVILDTNDKCGAASILDRIKCEDKTSRECCFKGLPNLTHIIPVAVDKESNNGRWFQALNTKNETYTDETITNDDVAYIFATSGSTGFAKMVPHTHGTSLAIARQFAVFLQVSEESVYFNNRSLGWIGGHPYMYPVSGGTRVLMNNTSGLPEDIGATILSILNQENCDCSFFVPSTVQLIVNAVDAGAHSNRRLRICMTGGNPLSTTTMKAIGRFAEVVLAVYGSTEMGVPVGMTVEDEASYENACVGYPGEAVELKVLGDNLEEVPVGVTGEVYIRSPTIAKCYLNNQVVSSETFLADGWYRSSDMGHLNEKGQLFVYCRKSNAINHQGVIHYPGWMEALINRHPGIQKCFVIGIPDPGNHEDICLCIIKLPHAKLTNEHLREFCKSLFLTSEKDSITPIPKHYLYFDSFPFNSNGKIDRKALRAESCQRLGICSN